MRNFGYFPTLAQRLANITADRGGVAAIPHCVGALTRHNCRRSSRQTRLTRCSAIVVLPGAATVRHATLHVRAPPNDPSLLALCNRVARPRGPSLGECRPEGNGRSGQNGVGFLDLRMRHPLSVHYMRAATPADKIRRCSGKNRVCFCRARIFPTWQLSRCGNFRWG